jgi:hypothetical protein
LRGSGELFNWGERAARSLKGGLRDLGLKLWPKQQSALDSPATELLYGGAAGSGKSHFFRAAAITWAHEIQGLQIYFFRRELPDLYKNHMEGNTGFPAMLAPWIESKYARINYSKNWISIGRSKIHLCHCQYEKDVYGYQGAEIHVLAPDELTQFTRSMYTYLRGRVRMNEELKATLPAEYRGLFPRVLGGTNPGGIGHNFVREMFIDPRPHGEIWQAPRKDGGMIRQFIPAKMKDNPSLDPEEYGAKLEGLPEYLRKAMLDGDWNIVAGGMFDDLWNAQTEDRIVVKPFEIPKTWRITRAMDWGSSKPFAVGWFAESDGTEAVMADGTRRSWYRGTLFEIGEWYGWNGRENEGCKLPPSEVAKGILEREEAMRIKGRVLPGPADSSIFDVDEGDSIAAKFARCGVRWEPADKSPGSRKSGAEDMRERLTEMAKPYMEGPGLGFFDTCREGSIRTIPTLPRDKNKTDDVDTNAEDHAYDKVRYRCMWGGVKSGSGKRPF